MGSLKGQNVVVVGGSRGVGRSIVEAALSEGATVLAIARGADALKELSWEASGVRTLAADATRDRFRTRAGTSSRPIGKWTSRRPSCSAGRRCAAG
ncbi:SDR family NAD(P)-dependent oxidoreductase [Mesorhizobium sp. B2-5-4]|uniref:SDR family NAD(P)-dependent oxidoreductase n=1 Tax=Mesorhizobium sp. B2-5-4 TaxID=2589926 RepID=UPI001FEE6B29|nr:SDR family NAD(P)-dependent oxidoreductase [Mesorhizobium sp. B2-5-4]